MIRTFKSAPRNLERKKKEIGRNLSSIMAVGYPHARRADVCHRIYNSRSMTVPSSISLSPCPICADNSSFPFLHSGLSSCFINFTLILLGRKKLYHTPTTSGKTWNPRRSFRFMTCATHLHSALRAHVYIVRSVCS